MTSVVIQAIGAASFMLCCALAAIGALSAADCILNPLCGG